MEKKLKELFLALGGIGISMFAAVKLLSGGWTDLIWFMVCLIPFVLALFLGLRNWWPLLAVIIPLIPIPQIGATLLDKFTPAMVFNLAMIAFFAGHICIRHQGVSFNTQYARPMLVVAVVITARLIMDPPGSGRVGGTGGLGQALNYLVAGWCFFSVWWATGSSLLPEAKLVRWILLFSLLMFGWFLVKSPDILQELYHRRSWIFYPFLLGWVAHRSGCLKNRWGLFYLLSLVVMGCGVINPHRKSLVMAGLVCMTAAWIFGRAKKQLIVLGISGVLGLTLLIATGHVPDVMKRSLSTILPSLTIEDNQRGSMGWEDDFRSRNFELAAQDILRHPVIGRGFSFSTAEVVAMLNRAERSGISGSSDIANAVGNQHYGFISLMTCIGAIFPWFYAAGGLGIFIWFIRTARALPDGYPKVLAAGLSGYFINNLFQWLFNGSGEQMLVVSIALGIMMGLLARWNSPANSKMMVDGLSVDGGDPDGAATVDGRQMMVDVPSERSFHGTGVGGPSGVAPASTGRVNGWSKRR
jgi:hypothetical protein